MKTTDSTKTLNPITESMLRAKAVIFDMDGVIIDSEGFWKQAEKEVFTSLGVEVTDEHAEVTQSMTTSEVTEFWYDKFPWENKDLKVVEEMVVSRVIDLIETEECLIKGVKDFIETIKSREYKVGLATNSPHVIASAVLERFELSHLFDTVSSAEFEDKGKPDPSVYNSTAKKLDTDKVNCLVIEDSYSGVLAAKRAGMTVLAFTNGNGETGFEIADHSFTSFEDIGTELIQSR